MTMTQKLEGETAGKKHYEHNIHQLTQERDDLIRRFNDLNRDYNQKVVEVNNLSPVVAQNESLRKKLTSYDSSITAYEGQVNKRFTAYQQNIDILSRENEELKKKLAEANDHIQRVSRQLEERVTYYSRELQKTHVHIKQIDNEKGKTTAELQNRVGVISQQLQRVNASLRNKCDDYNKL